MSTESPRSRSHELPLSRALRLSSVDQASAVFSQWNGQFEQMSPGALDSTLRIARGRQLRIVEIQVNQNVRSRGRDVTGEFSAFPVLRSNATSVWQGRRLEPGQLVANGVDAGIDHYTGRHSQVVGVFLNPEFLEQSARTLLGSDAFSLPRTWAAHVPPPERLSGLARQLTVLLERGIADPRFLGSAEGHEQEQETIRQLVHTLCPGDPGPGRAGASARTRIVRRAEEFMRAQLTQPLGTIDLCRAVSTSDRTIRLAFRELYGMGPMTYFRSLRLNAVRNRLCSAPWISVADAARSFGFQHLGNFAADYRRLFGERPSETRRLRSVDERLG